MEFTTSFVSSRGLLKSFRAHNINPISSSDIIDYNILDNHNFENWIYICTDALIKFLETYLNRIDHNFILVSGDSDISINEQVLNHKSIQRLLNDKRLIK